MAAMFPESGESKDFSRDGLIAWVSGTSKDIQYLTKAVETLTLRIEELANRFDTDADELRTSQGEVHEVRTTQLELARRLIAVETDIGKIRAEVIASDLKKDERIKVLETWLIQAKAVGVLLGLIGGSVGSLLYFVIGKIWK